MSLAGRRGSVAHDDDEGAASRAAAEHDEARGKKKKKKKRQGIMDNSAEEWSEAEGWLRKDDKKRYCKLRQNTLAVYKKEESQNPTLTLDLGLITNVQAEGDLVQIEYEEEALDFVTKDEDEAQAWEDAILRNIDLLD